MATHVPVIVLFISAPLPHDVAIYVWDRGPRLVTYLMDEILFPPFVCLLLEMAVNREAAHWARLNSNPEPPTSIKRAG